jgi:hypothetical protein
VVQISRDVIVKTLNQNQLFDEDFDNKVTVETIKIDLNGRCLFNQMHSRGTRSG